MKYRTTHILAQTTLDTEGGTETISLKVKDPISRLTLGYDVTGVDKAKIAPLAAGLTKIELVDGSDVLFSMDGYECQALAIYDRRVNTLNHGQYIIGNAIYGSFPIDFGRFLHDPELAFDPKKFDNPMLKVTYDTDACDASATVSHLEVWADCFDERTISPIGFLMSKEHWKQTITTDNYSYVDLPLDHTIRKLLVRGFKTQQAPWYCIAQARIDEDNEKRVPFNWDMEDYHRIMKGVWLPVIEQIVDYANENGDFDIYVTPTDYYVVWAGLPQGSYNVWTATYSPGGYVQRHASGTTMVSGIVYGWCPHHCIEFPFGDQRDIADWYDVALKESVRLRLKGSAETTPGVGSVVLQQLRRY